MNMLRNLALGAVALAASLSAHAAAFNNGSFELGTYTDNAGPGSYFTGDATYGNKTNDDAMALVAGNTALSSWTVSMSGALAWIDTPNSWAAASQGAKFLDLTGWSSVWSETQESGSLSRVMVSQTFDTVAGTTYTVNFDLGYDTTDSRLSNLSVNNSTVFAGVNGVYSTFNSNVNGWSNKSLTFVATGAQSTLSFQAGSYKSEYVGLDNVTVTAAPVPEPETYAMMLAGLGALGFMARRRKAQ